MRRYGKNGQKESPCIMYPIKFCVVSPNTQKRKKSFNQSLRRRPVVFFIVFQTAAILRPFDCEMVLSIPGSIGKNYVIFSEFDY